MRYIMNDKIQLQQNIAQDILHKLEIIDPTCILAGGAPRNWYLGKSANDLDFYIHSSHQNMKSRLKTLGLQVVHMSSAKFQNSAYPDMKKIKAIFEGNIDGQEYQIMVMSESTFNCVVSKFGTSVCEAWYKHKRVNTTDSFKLSHYLKTIYVKPDYNAKVKHINKMQTYFPDYKTKPASELEKDVKDLATQFGVSNNTWAVIKELMKLEN